ncbi:MAG: transglycosylase SLT domain-containing protein [Candidatus Acidiferrum sp.]
MAIALPYIGPALFSFMGETTTATAETQIASEEVTIGEQFANAGIEAFNSTVTSNLSAIGLGTLGAAAATGAGLTSNPQKSIPQTPDQKFKDCVKKYGDSNAQSNLTYQGYQDAQQAAQAAHITTSQELALWDNENSLKLDWPAPKPTGEMGPIQIRPPAITTLANSRPSLLPQSYATDVVVNLTAGGRYFALMLGRFGAKRAAAAYNAGAAGARRGFGQNYQKAFDKHLQMAQNVDNCMH